jgi:phage gpG-like protein
MSFKINVKVSENPAVERATDFRRAQVGIIRGMKKIGKDLTLTARGGIRARNKTGRVYNYKGRKHRAGAVGEYPAKRSGNLGRSINYEVGGFRLEFGTSIEYAKYLQQWDNPENPTSTWKKVGPRPFLQLSHDSNKDNFERIMSDSIESEFNL